MGGKQGGGKIKYTIPEETLMDCLERNNWHKRNVARELGVPFYVILDRCRKIKRPMDD